MSAPSVPARRRPVQVSINGKQYGVVTDRDKEWMREVAAQVERAMARVRDRTETVDSLDIAVLTALNLAQNLMILRDEGVVPSEAERAQNRVNAQRLRDIAQLAEDALRAEPQS
jgi:cell division protein ZapA (FtsZ GTPase activity inhibitor)